MSIASSLPFSAWARWLGLNLLIAVVYAILSLVAFELTGYSKTTACPFWPSAGWAMGFVLFYGWRALPGLFAGACMANAIGLKISAVALSPGMLVLLSMIRSFGATLQAWLILCMVGPVNNSHRFWEVFTFRRFVIPVFLGCGCGSIIGITSGWILGVEDPGQIFGLIAIWWIGDFVGILVIQPLLLPVLANVARRLSSRGKWTVVGFLANPMRWRKGLATVGMIVLCCWLLWLRTGVGMAVVILLIVVTCKQIGPISCNLLTFAVCLWSAWLSSASLTHSLPQGLVRLPGWMVGQNEEVLNRAFHLVMYLLTVVLAGLVITRLYGQLGAKTEEEKNLWLLLPCGTFHADKQGNFTQANEEAIQALGLETNEEVKHDGWAARLPDHRREKEVRRWKEWVSQASKDNTSPRYDRVIGLLPGKEFRYLRILALPVCNREGDIEGFVGVLMHVDSRADSKTMRDGLSVIHHDAKNHVTALHDPLDKLGNLPREAMERLEMLRKTLQAMEPVLMPVAKDNVIQRVRVDSVLTERFARNTKKLGRLRGLDLQTKDAPEWVWCRADILNGVLDKVLNVLLENATTHSEQTIQISAWLKPNEPTKLWMAVEDDGTGMQPEQAEDLRQRMRTGHVRRKGDSDKGGQGNGLVQVNNLLLPLGTELILVPNAKGNLNRFEFGLPLSSPGVRPAPKRILALGEPASFGPGLTEACSKEELDLVSAVDMMQLDQAIQGGPPILILAVPESRLLLNHARNHLDGVPAAVVVETLSLTKDRADEIPRTEIANMLYRASRGMDVPVWMSLGPVRSEKLRRRLETCDILIVEDDADHGVMIVRKLLLWGARSATLVRTCHEAEEWAKRCVFALVLLDEGLKDGSGSALAHLFLDGLQHPPGSPRPVVVSISGSPSLVQENRLPSLPKNFAPGQLETLLPQIPEDVEPPRQATGWMQVAGFRFNLAEIHSARGGMTEATLMDLLNRFRTPLHIIQTVLKIQNPPSKDHRILIRTCLHNLQTNANQIQCSSLQTIFESGLKRVPLESIDPMETLAPLESTDEIAVECFLRDLLLEWPLVPMYPSPNLV